VYVGDDHTTSAYIQYAEKVDIDLYLHSFVNIMHTLQEVQGGYTLDSVELRKWLEFLPLELHPCDVPCPIPLLLLVDTLITCRR
jgi:hypothetical protein